MHREASGVEEPRKLGDEPGHMELQYSLGQIPFDETPVCVWRTVEMDPLRKARRKPGGFRGLSEAKRSIQNGGTMFCLEFVSLVAGSRTHHPSYV